MPYPPIPLFVLAIIAFVGFVIALAWAAHQTGSLAKAREIEKSRKGPVAHMPKQPVIRPTVRHDQAA